MKTWKLCISSLSVFCLGCAPGFGVGKVKSTQSTSTSIISLPGILAGSPIYGSNDGYRTSVHYSMPWGITIDTSGNLYVADQNLDIIRKITAAGVVSTLAGKAGVQGSTDGIGSAASFYSPSSLAIDSSGNIFVADTSNHLIRKITPAGVVTTFAGTAGNAGSSDGTGSAARFYNPYGIAIDPSDNLFVADTQYSTIRKITPAGVVTTFAGQAGMSGTTDGTGSAARFNTPQGLTVDSSGNVFVADCGNYTIRKITPAQVVTTVAGTAGTSGNVDATGTAAQFSSPMAITVDSSGNFYVVGYDHQVRKMTSAFVVTTLAGSTTSGHIDATGTAARFAYPTGITVDSSGNLYIADSNNHQIRQISSGNVVTTHSGTATSWGIVDGTGSAASFQAPHGLAADSAGNIYVADTFNDTIRKVTLAGVVTTLAGMPVTTGTADGTGSGARFYWPWAIAIDSSGNLLVTDAYNHTIRKITTAGVVTTFAGTAGISGSTDATGTSAKFNDPTGLAIDSSDNLYVADQANHVIRKITSTGVVTTLAGTAGASGNTDATGAAARFNFPSGVTVDSTGTNLYISDYSNCRIRKLVIATGVVTTIAGSSIGFVDGTGAGAKFYSLQDIKMSASGNLYIADDTTVRMVTTAGVVTTVNGIHAAKGSDGKGSNALFSNVAGLAFDIWGDLFVSDSSNNTIAVP